MFMLANSKEATADDSLSCSFLKDWNFVSKFDVVLLRFSKKKPKSKTNINSYCIDLYQYKHLCEKYVIILRVLNDIS